MIIFTNSTNILYYVGGIEGYKNLEFSDGSLLFALSELPTYKLTAWNWKAAEKMVESPGKFICANQQLRYLLSFWFRSNS